LCKQQKKSGKTGKILWIIKVDVWAISCNNMPVKEGGSYGKK
jgi:hypothetical protein